MQGDRELLWLEPFHISDCGMEEYLRSNIVLRWRGMISNPILFFDRRQVMDGTVVLVEVELALPQHRLSFKVHICLRTVQLAYIEITIFY